VLTATVTHLAGTRAVTVHLSQAPASATTEAETTEKAGPSPIAPEPKELVWTAGAFVVFAVLMRYVFYPRLRKGTAARYDSIRERHEGADATRAAAKAEVADYEAELAQVKAQAAQRLDAARRVLEAERSARLKDVNAEIAAERARAAAEAEQARAAVRGDLAVAVTDVARRASELAIGKAPDPDVLQRVVSEVMSVGVNR
jgi:F-type H+-transporting ATPase subunit b